MSNLPETVTTLYCPNGSVVYVVGTAHFSKESIEDVRQVIRTKRPDAVVLELCQDRKMLLQYSEEDILREASTMTVAKMRSFVHRDGLVAGLAQFMFLNLSAELTRQLGVAPGGEFRAGYEEGIRLSARVILGDRLIGVTFKRVMAALSLWQRLRLTILMVRMLVSKLEITQEDLEQLKTRDMVTLFIGELSTEYPALVRVLVEERDQVLTHSLKSAANCALQPHGPPVTVVGVMGMGHVPGVELNWETESDVRELLTVPQPSHTSRFLWAGFRIGTKIGILGACAVTVYLIARRVTS